MGCKDYICEEDDPCESNSPKDELNDKAPEKEEVKLSEGEAMPPAPAAVKLGSVLWDVEVYLQQGIVAKRIGTKTAASVTLRPGHKIPGKVIDDCIKKLNDGEADQLLDGVSDEDAIFQFVADTTETQWHDAIKWSLGYPNGKFFPGGDSFNQPLFKRKVTIDYWAQGTFEGCEEGTSEDYADDKSPCGYGRWTVNGPLYWTRPNNPTKINPVSLPNPFNPMTEYNQFVNSWEQGFNQANSQWSSQLIGIPPEYRGPIYLEAEGKMSDFGGIGFTKGDGYVKFGGVTVYGFNEDMGSTVVEGRIHLHKWDMEAWIQGEDVFADFGRFMKGAFWDTASHYWQFGQLIIQADDMPQALGETANKVGSFIGSILPLNNSHGQVQVGIIDVIVQVFQDAPAAPNQAIETGSTQYGGESVKKAEHVNRVGGQKGTCWLARAVYGENNPEWKRFREYIYNIAPHWQKEIYIKYAPRLSRYVKKNNLFRTLLKCWMNTKLV